MLTDGQMTALTNKGRRHQPPVPAADVHAWFIDCLWPQA